MNYSLTHLWNLIKTRWQIMLSAKVRAGLHRKCIHRFHSWFLEPPGREPAPTGMPWWVALRWGRWVNGRGELAHLGAFAWACGALFIVNHFSALFKSPGIVTSIRLRFLPASVHAIIGQFFQVVVMVTSVPPESPMTFTAVSLIELALSCHNTRTLASSLTLFPGP